ncbi:hypothetical protein PYH37_001229 [Sinorhizobium numidicum]|uniref:Uncharacterized protein n=1 Tax=Sinorhizobium numidicum TaxID=680248 RepID=A0ABY8CUG2_9HYPH|nr:hypothetical protein [Sinorhizobium numidicum]WEX75804.1 hypothetical protein PYH37_001229 [Sinorhizobium numidicum]WEX81787.1 hypothetical protein PYH38_001230 [Sinorhizobium numidicum]
MARLYGEGAAVGDGDAADGRGSGECIGAPWFRQFQAIGMVLKAIERRGDD